MFLLTTSLLLISLDIALAQNSCDTELSTEFWDGTAETWGSETTIAAYDWIETKQTYTRPIIVEAEMMGASSSECISMTLFATTHDNNVNYAFLTGGYGNRIMMWPGGYSETVGYNNDDWDTVRIELTEDQAKFYFNGTLKHTVTDASLTSGTIQFVAGCVSMKVRNPQIISGGNCSYSTPSPTTEPTESCDASAMHAVNWHDLINDDDSADVLMHDSSIEFDASTLSLTFKASLEYVGLAADGNFDDDYNLGTTYWIGFESFAAVDDGLEAAGTCANRDGADYGDLEWAQFWDFTVDPADLAAASTEERTAYPASDWALTAKNCSVVEYELTLSWTDMTACDGSAGNAIIDVTETDDAITLSGTFYVEFVSPYSMSAEGYYRTFPLIQQDFAIVLDRQVDALASTGVQLFISTVMAYGRDDDGNYELTILVQSADYVKLGTGNDVTLIDGPWDTSDIQTVTGDDCLVASSFTCGQIFTATIPAECSTDDNTVDLSGTYQFSFDPDCQTLDDGSEDPACTTFLTTVGEAGVVLDVDSSFTDNCDVDLFNVTFGADLTFYEDESFTVAVNDNSDPFVIGQDTIYGKVLVDIAVDETDTMYTFVEISIVNVYVCTAEDELSLDSDSGIGGCLSSDIDVDGPYVVYGTGAVTEYEGTTYAATGNEATFSFLTFDTPRTTINVHVQLLLTLTTESGERRRMLLQTDTQSEEGNAFRSFIGTASVQEGETTADPVGTDGAAKVSTSFIAAMFVSAYVLVLNFLE